MILAVLPAPVQLKVAYSASMIVGVIQNAWGNSVCISWYAGGMHGWNGCGSWKCCGIVAVSGIMGFQYISSTLPSLVVARDELVLPLCIRLPVHRSGNERCHTVVIFVDSRLVC